MFFFCRRWLHEALNTLKHEGTHMFDCQLFACSECLNRDDKTHTTRNAIRWATEPWVAPRAKVVDAHLRYGMQACRTRPSASEHICAAWKFVEDLQYDLDRNATTLGVKDEAKAGDDDKTTTATSKSSSSAAPKLKITDQMTAAQVKAAALSNAKGTLTKWNKKTRI